jgi:ribosomal protein S18 acetylase RimI-like enzyme
LGRALLLHAFAELRRRGFRRAGLGVDAESLTGAHKLYESAGMHVEARFDVYEKPAA